MSQIPFQYAHLRSRIKWISKRYSQSQGAGCVLYGHFECSLECCRPTRVTWIDPATVPAQLLNTFESISCGTSNMILLKEKLLQWINSKLHSYITLEAKLLLMQFNVAGPWNRSGHWEADCGHSHPSSWWSDHLAQTDQCETMQASFRLEWSCLVECPSNCDQWQINFTWMANLDQRQTPYPPPPPPGPWVGRGEGGCATGLDILNQYLLAFLSFSEDIPFPRLQHLAITLRHVPRRAW